MMRLQNKTGNARLDSSRFRKGEGNRAEGPEQDARQEVINQDEADLSK